MNRLMLAFPLYTSASTKFFWRLQVMNARNVIHKTSIDGVYLPKGMEGMVAEALKLPDWDRLVVIEQDMVPPAYAFERMNAYPSTHGVIGSMYFHHSPPHEAMVYMNLGDRDYHAITAETVKQWCDEPALREVGAVGFGFTSIARNVLENWPKDLPMCKAEDDFFQSHDFWFCHHARKLGHRVYVDSGMVCGHLTEVEIGLADNQRCAPKDEPAIEFNFQRTSTQDARIVTSAAPS